MGSNASDVGYVQLVRTNVNFRRLWLGNVVSLLGDWFNFIALVALVGGLTGSPLAVAGVFVARMLPWALVSPLAGVLVDRFSRRRLMIAADLLRAVIVLGFLFVEDASDAFLVYALQTAQVVAGSVFQPAKNASIPNVTAPHELVTANALNAATWSTMLAVGAGLGGLAAEAFGPRPVFIIDSLTYLISAVFTFRTVIPQATEADDVPLVRTAARKVLEGWRRMRERPEVGRIALAKAAWAAAGGGLVFMLTLLGDAITPGAQAAGIGVLFMARGIGTGIGPIAARALFRDDRSWPTVLGGCIAASGLLYALGGALPWGYAALSMTLVAGCVVLAHAASGANWVLATILLQQRTEDRFRGRIFATDWLLVMLADTVSILTAGFLLETGALTLKVAFLTFASVQVLVGFAWLTLMAPRERRWQQRMAAEQAAHDRGEEEEKGTNGGGGEAEAAEAYARRLDR